MKDVSCVNQLSFAKLVAKVPTVALDLPVGARLYKFWETWEALGASQKATLPFQIQPNLTGSPIIISCYVNAHRNLYLLQALHQLMNKNAVKISTDYKNNITQTNKYILGTYY